MVFKTKTVSKGQNLFVFLESRCENATATQTFQLNMIQDKSQAQTGYCVWLIRRIVKLLTEILIN